MIARRGPCQLTVSLQDETEYETLFSRKRESVVTSSSEQLVEGQATYGMANLRSERTGLPFIVFISQRDDARHAARVKVSPNPRIAKDRMGSYSLSPVEHKAGFRLPGPEERQLERWIALNLVVLEGYWTGSIEYTEDALAQLRSL